MPKPKQETIEKDREQIRDRRRKNLGVRIKHAIQEAERRGDTSTELIAHEMGRDVRSLERYKATGDDRTDISAIALKVVADQTRMPYSWFVRDLDNTYPQGNEDGRASAEAEARLETKAVNLAARNSVHKADSIRALLTSFIRILYEASPEQLDAARAQLDKSRPRRG